MTPNTRGRISALRVSRVLIIASLTLKVTLCGTLYVVCNGPIIHNTIETCLKRVEYGG